MRTLQEIVRNHLVLETGLESLSKLVKTDRILPQLPPCIRQFLLTFPCQEFEVTLNNKKIIKIKQFKVARLELKSVLTL